ncbi:SitI3 family protein [Actinoplanes sp. NPDC049548]|uniref:SitI3 family protein n=1 Tax=Actinoplanes sp. NPDC049548 TaxID=3155152 RepID=UPI003418FA1F
MATEYTYYSAADLTTEELRSALTAALGGSLASDGTVVREGLSAWAHRVEPGDEAAAPRLFRFPHRLTCRFRFSATRRELEEHNTALMVGAFLAITDRTGADSVLLFNGEEAVLQSVGGEAVFASNWEDWDTLPEVSALRTGRRVAQLSQPLL